MHPCPRSTFLLYTMVIGFADAEAAWRVGSLGFPVGARSDGVANNVNRLSFSRPREANVSQRDSRVLLHERDPRHALDFTRFASASHGSLLGLACDSRRVRPRRNACGSAYQRTASLVPPAPHRGLDSDDNLVPPQRQACTLEKRSTPLSRTR